MAANFLTAPYIFLLIGPITALLILGSGLVPAGNASRSRYYVSSSLELDDDAPAFSGVEKGVRPNSRRIVPRDGGATRIEARRRHHPNSPNSSHRRRRRPTGGGGGHGGDGTVVDVNEEDLVIEVTIENADGGGDRNKAEEQQTTTTEQPAMTTEDNKPMKELEQLLRQHQQQLQEHQQELHQLRRAHSVPLNDAQRQRPQFVVPAGKPQHQQMRMQQFHHQAPQRFYGSPSSKVYHNSPSNKRMAGLMTVDDLAAAANQEFYNQQQQMSQPMQVPIVVMNLQPAPAPAPSSGDSPAPMAISINDDREASFLSISGTASQISPDTIMLVAQEDATAPPKRHGRSTTSTTTEATPAADDGNNKPSYQQIVWMPPPAAKRGAVDFSHLTRKTSVMNCDGLRWDVIPGVYECCGQSLYRKASEQCGQPGNIVERRTNPPLHRPTTTTTLQPTQVLMCQTRRYSIPQYDAEFYACCNDKVYFWLRDTCIDGEVSSGNLHPSITTPSTVKTATVLLLCGGVANWIDARFRRNYGCCGTRPIDTRVELCHSRAANEMGKYLKQPPVDATVTAPLTMEPTTQPPSDSNCPSGYICCSDFAPVLNLDGELQCCDELGPQPVDSSQC